MAHTNRPKLLDLTADYADHADMENIRAIREIRGQDVWAGISRWSRGRILFV